MQQTWEIKGHLVEFLEEEHIYLCDGMILPSITQIMKIKFGNKYDGISKEVLQKASERGSAVHKAIEYFEKYKVNDISSTELRNYKFLKKKHKFECLDNEVPVIIFWNKEENRPATREEIEAGIGEPIACGTLDLVLKEIIETGLGDIKSTSRLDKDYLGYQLNLYRIGFQQCYDIEIKFLRGLHLRKDVRKYIPIPINEKVATSLLNEFLEKGK